MTSAEDIEKLKFAVLWDMLDDGKDYEILESILKDLEELKQCVPYGRQAGKEVMVLNQALHKITDDPIFFVSHSDIGNRYIVPQKQFEQMQKDLERLAKYEEILKDRLTKKIENPQYSNDYDLICAHSYHALNKLGRLEDIYAKANITLEVKDDTIRSL